MQHGLERSSGRDGLNCWSSWYDSIGWMGEAKGFLWWGVTARRDGGMQLTPLRVHEIVAF